MKKAKECLSRGDDKDIKDAESHLNALCVLFQRGIWGNPEFLIDMLRDAASSSHLATDKEQYNTLLQEGVAAIEANDPDELRRILVRLLDMQIRVGAAKNSLDKLASVMRLAV